MTITLAQNRMIRVACLVLGGGMTVAEILLWCQATTAMWMVAATRPLTLNNDAGLHWVELIFFFFRSSIVWWWKVNVASVSTLQWFTMHMSPLKLQFFTSFLTQNNAFYFSFDATYYIAFHTLVTPNIMFNFRWCCMLQSFLCVLRLLYHPMHITVILAFMLKIGNFNAEKFDVAAPYCP